MSKKIKLKQRDIENIVKNIVQEQEDMRTDTNMSEQPPGDVIIVRSTENPDDVYLFNRKTQEIVHRFKS